MAKPPIVAFYSFKGGVGRTTALANVGYLLAQQGLHVFLWDFDLDAPNLHTLVRIMAGDAGGAPQVGFADYLVHWEETGEAPESLESYLWSFPIGDQGGMIDFFGAGFNGPEYVTKLARIHWEDFYRRDGLALLQHLCAQAKVREPAVVLLDARAGMTDLAFTAALQLADLTVLVYRLNPDGIEGIRTMHNLFALRESPKLSFLYVASMVPHSEFKLATDLKMRARSQGVGVDVELPMEPLLFLLDEIYANSRPDHFLSEQYRTLANLIWERVQSHEAGTPFRRLFGDEQETGSFQSKVATLYRLLAYQTDSAPEGSGLHFLALDRRGGMDLRLGIVCQENRIDLASLGMWSTAAAELDRIVLVTRHLADPGVARAARAQRILILSYAELLA